jgi:chromosome segregation ATPase
MDKRSEYVEKLSAQMVEWDNEIERLKDRAESLGPDDKTDYSQRIAALQSKRDEAAQKLQGISTGTDDEWKDMKQGTEQVWGEVRGMLRDSITKVK